MKKITATILILILFSAVNAASRERWLGVWGIWNTAYSIDTSDKPWYKGTIITRQWATIEASSDNDWQWSTLDSRVEDAVNDNHWIIIKIYVGGAYCPTWVYSSGVPEVKVSTVSFPYYLDADFKAHFKDMIDELYSHIDTAYTTEERKRIIGVQCAVGISGDPQPWNGSVDSGYESYEIDSGGQDWEDYSSEMILYYNTKFSAARPPIYVMAKPYEDLHDDLMVSNPEIGRKSFSVAQGYQLCNEMNYDWLKDDLNPPQTGTLMYARGELDHAVEEDVGWFTQAVEWNVYWHCLWMLTYGVDMLASYEDLYEDYFASYPDIADSFVFFNKYAGYKNPATSPGAWIALRDGLDCKDWERFSTGTYGSLTHATEGYGNNDVRYAAILADFTAYGALQGDTTIMNDTILASADADYLNDVGWNIYADNYKMHMTQYSALTTSQGYWRQGGTGQPYGRFARGFDYSGGKNTMYFDIADTWYNGKPVNIRVVYYDDGTGTWRLSYDGKTGTTIAYTHTNTDTDTWLEKIVTISDAKFENGCTNDTDILLINPDTTDEIFHMIEIYYSLDKISGHSMSGMTMK